MAKSGPRPAPTALKIVHGEKPSRINTNEPKPAQTDRAPSCPSWLSPGARRVWPRLAPDLHRKGLLTEWDREPFAVFCEAVDHHRKACEAVDGSAILVRGGHGALA